MSSVEDCKGLKMKSAVAFVFLVDLAFSANLNLPQQVRRLFSAQQDFKQSPQGNVNCKDPCKVDEYGDVNFEDSMARLDRLAVMLGDSPNYKLYIIGYRGQNELPGKVLRNLNFAKLYLLKARGVNPSRIITVEGRRRESLNIEFWLIENGASPPLPTPASQSVEEMNKRMPHKFDEDYAVEPFRNIDDTIVPLSLYDREVEDLRGFAQALQNEPTSRGYIIVYAGADDPVSRARKIAKLLKDLLTKEFKIEASRVATAYGGRRESMTKELWILPEGASTPLPNAAKPVKHHLKLGTKN